VETTEPLKTDRWQHVVVTYDGSRVATGVNVYVDGQPVQLRVLVDELNQDFAAKLQPFVIGTGGPGPRYSGRLDELRVYGRVLSADEAECWQRFLPIDAIATLPATSRTPVQARKLAECFLDQHAPAPIAGVRSELFQLEQQKLKLEQSIPTTMVMQEMPRRGHVCVVER